jgi:hypothetical protein
MTPKEKAIELTGIYLESTKKSLDRIGWFYDIDVAKQCALIAVKELIKETGSKYWYDVKQEIEKI